MERPQAVRFRATTHRPILLVMANVRCPGRDCVDVFVHIQRLSETKHVTVREAKH